MRKVILFYNAIIIFQLLFADQARSQEIRNCGTMEYLQLQEQLHPGSIQQWKDAEAMAEEWIKTHPSDSRSTITIPVVVHVVYNTQQQNISDNQVSSQIDVLNEDFNHNNADTSNTPDVWKPVAGSIPVMFCLAKYDPNGDSTSGITRTQTDIKSFSLGDSVKHSNLGGADSWPCKHYLNIWVCNLSNSTLGYTTLPTSNCDNNDGVVVLYSAFGRVGTVHYPYNKGRTATHEVGHWLGLTHPSGDDGGTCSGDDGCSDTPLEADNVFNCPSFPFIDQCTGPPNGVMFMNYMDYTDDACMNLFTQCQTTKMLGVLNSQRLSIQSSPAGCQGLVFNLDASISTISAPVDTITSEGFIPKVQLTNRGIDELTYVEINFKVDGQDTATFVYNGNLASQLSEIVSLPAYFTGEFGHVSYAWTASPNHGTDQFVFNDTASQPFFVRSSVSKNTTSISVVQDASTDHPQITVLNPSASMMHLRVVNVLGQIIQEGDWAVMSEPTITIDLSNEAAGVYFIYGKIGYDYVKKKIMVLRN